MEGKSIDLSDVNDDTVLSQTKHALIGIGMASFL